MSIDNTFELNNFNINEYSCAGLISKSLIKTVMGHNFVILLIFFKHTVNITNPLENLRSSNYMYMYV